MINFTATTKKPNEISSDALVVFLRQEETAPEEKIVNALCGGQIQKLRQSKDFLGEPTKVRTLFNVPGCPRVLLVGLGKTAELTLEKLREAASIATQTLKSLPATSASIILPKIPKTTAEETAQAICESLSLACYEFNHYKTGKKDKPKIENIEIIVSQKEKREAEKGLAFARILAGAVITARDLGNHPSNIATPSHLAEHALRIGKERKNIKIKILHKPEIKKERMGGLLAVSKGSDEEPKFIILEYLPKKPARRGGGSFPTVVLAGKGITFDSGGISIKPADKMEEMKYDMAGAATVMATIKAASELKLPINLVGLIPATENLPSGKAIKPGDIITSRSGKTIEVVNTDAEGRLVLSDALDYAKKYNPTLVVDLATLTGAIMVALGDDIIGAFTNAEKYLGPLKTAAKTTGEKIWPMPLEKDYEQFIKSDFADLRNIGTTRYGDSVNAANFLKAFVDYPWIHLDIAGVAWATREKPYRPKGATGAGLRLMIEFLKKFKK